MLKSRSKKSQKKKNASDVPKLTHKERLAQKRKSRQARQKFVGRLLVSVLVGMVLGLPLIFLIELKIGLSVAIAIPCLILSFLYPRQALWAFLIYLPFSGTVIYWVGGGNASFQLAKDIFYLPALLGLIVECRRKKQPIFVAKEILPTLAFLVFTCLMTLLIVNGSKQFLPFCSDLTEQFLRAPDGSYILNPQTGLVIRVPCKDGIPILQGILGFKVILGYVPLIFCAHQLIQDKQRLLFLGRLLLVLAIIACSLGIIQYWLLESGRCAGTRAAEGIGLFKANINAKCFVGGALLYSPSQGEIRLPGTFVSPWHWSWFLVANGVVCFATAFSDKSFFWRMGGLAGMSLIFVNAVISGQRLALVMVPALIIALLFLTGQIINLKRFIPVGIGFALLFGAVTISEPQIVQNRIDSFVARWNASPPHIFIQKQLAFAVENQEGILGHGLGTGTNSTRVFGNVALIETFHAKLLYELGYIGLLAFLIFVIHLSIIGFKKYRSVRDPLLRGYGSSFWVFVVLISFFPYWYPLDTDPVSVYYWFFAGVIFKLPEIQQQENEKLKAQTSRSRTTKRKPRTFGKRVTYRPTS